MSILFNCTGWENRQSCRCVQFTREELFWCFAGAQFFYYSNAFAFLHGTKPGHKGLPRAYSGPSLLIRLKEKVEAGQKAWASPSGSASPGLLNFMSGVIFQPPPITCRPTITVRSAVNFFNACPPFSLPHLNRTSLPLESA